MNSFKCRECSYNTIRNYDLTRHLKNVYGIYVNTSVKGVTQPQSGLSSRMSEEGQYGDVSHIQQSRTDHTEKMNNTTIKHYLSSRCRGQFMGVFSSDTLPTSIKKRPAIIVCNTDPSDRGGEHWICIYVDRNRCGEFFDSFGRRPCQPFCSFMDKHCIN